MQDLHPRLYTSQFWLLCLSHVLFAASFTMILAELPAYLTSMGGGQYKGLIISLFTLTAGISRPFSGKLSDTVGRMPVMIFGTLVCVVCSLAYPILSSISGFLFLRLIHGFSTGFKPTASTAFVADIVPAHRRGEAMGVLGVSMNVGASGSPPLGSWIAQTFSMDAMFYASSALALLSILILMGLKETLEEPQRFSLRLLILDPKQIIDKTAIPPAMVILFLYFSYGVILTIVPDQTVHLGMSNKGLPLAAVTFSSIASRLVAGKISDRVGRVPVIWLAIIATAASLVFMGYSNSPMSLMISSGCFGFSVGMAAPAVFAWTIDRAVDKKRGQAVATVYIALEIGIGSGALISAWIYANQAENFPLAFFVTGAVTLLAAIYLSLWSRFSKVEQSPT